MFFEKILTLEDLQGKLKLENYICELKKKDVALIYILIFLFVNTEAHIPLHLTPCALYSETVWLLIS